jgi:prepilin peptidase CpaA
MSGVLVAQLFALLVAATATVTDWRTGHIPNWLTFPPMLAAPIVHGLFSGIPGFTLSLIGIAACGLVPYIVFKLGGMAGGDVKLLAALGAVLGPFVGIEAEFIAFIVAAIFALGRLAWEGKLLRTLGNTGRLAVNPFLPRRKRREVPDEMMSSMRLGASIFVGTLIAVLLRNPLLWGL